MPRSSSGLFPEEPGGGPDGRRARPWRRWRGWALGLLLFAGLIAAGLVGALWRLEAPGPLPQVEAIVIPEGSTMLVARRLVQTGVITQPRFFGLVAFLTAASGPLHAAELSFPAHASIAKVLSVLRYGPPVEHRLVIPEGFTAKEITTLMLQAPGLVGPADLPAEGYVLPATYDYLHGSQRQAIIRRAHAALGRVLRRLWEARAPGLPFTDPMQALTLASIVERETAIAAERPRIAAVFINRLRLGMKLQSDPTVIYAASDGEGVLSRSLSPKDLAIKSPYNTYFVPGLPPGPIDAPGIASIRAVLHPLPSPDLYFVADGSGGHAFARTLEGQDRNIRLWRQRVKEAPIPPAPQSAMTRGGITSGHRALTRKVRGSGA